MWLTSVCARGVAHAWTAARARQLSYPRLCDARAVTRAGRVTNSLLAGRPRQLVAISKPRPSNISLFRPQHARGTACSIEMHSEMHSDQCRLKWRLAAGKASKPADILSPALPHSVAGSACSRLGAPPQSLAQCSPEVQALQLAGCAKRPVQSADRTPRAAPARRPPKSPLASLRPSGSQAWLLPAPTSCQLSPLTLPRAFVLLTRIRPS